MAWMSSGRVVADAGCGGSRRSWRRRCEPWRVAGDELVEHRRDVVPDLAVELAALPTAPQSDQEIPGEPRGTSHSRDRRFVSFLLRRRALGTRLRCLRNVDHPDLNGRLAGPTTGHCGDVPAPARAPHGAPAAARIRDRRAALRTPPRLLPRHESTVPNRPHIRITETSAEPECIGCAVDGILGFRGRDVAAGRRVEAGRLRGSRSGGAGAVAVVVAAVCLALRGGLSETREVELAPGRGRGRSRLGSRRGGGGMRPEAMNHDGAPRPTSQPVERRARTRTRRHTAAPSSSYRSERPLSLDPTTRPG